MSDTEEDRGIARRKVLTAVAGAGGFGLASGVGTAALLSDRESFGGLFGTGSLELAVSWADGEVDGGSVTPEGGRNVRAVIEEGDRSGSALLQVSLPGPENNPAHVWFRPTCPSDPALADELELSIRYSDADGSEGDFVRDATGTEIEGVALGTLAERKGSKLQFGGTPCLAADVVRYLLVEWEYTGDGTGSGDAPEFDLAFSAEQCRNNDSPRNPYGDPPSCGPESTPTATQEGTHD